MSQFLETLWSTLNSKTPKPNSFSKTIMKVTHRLGKVTARLEVSVEMVARRPEVVEGETDPDKGVASIDKAAKI
jgi:hypothetical protein